MTGLAGAVSMKLAKLSDDRTSDETKPAKERNEELRSRGAEEQRAGAQTPLKLGRDLLGTNSWQPPSPPPPLVFPTLFRPVDTTSFFLTYPFFPSLSLSNGASARSSCVCVCVCVCACAILFFVSRMYFIACLLSTFFFARLICCLLPNYFASLCSCAWAGDAGKQRPASSRTFVPVSAMALGKNVCIDMVRGGV